MINQMYALLQCTCCYIATYISLIYIYFCKNVQKTFRNLGLSSRFYNFSAVSCNIHKEWVRLTKSCHYISSVTLMFEAHYITGQWGEFIRKCYLMLSFTFFAFFFFVFIDWISVLNEVSNFRSRILTNQKDELKVSNCR